MGHLELKDEVNHLKNIILLQRSEMQEMDSATAGMRTGAHLVSSTLEKNALDKLIKQCDLKKKLIKIAKSVGAFLVLNEAKCPELVGTCFGRGTQFIVTNNHVWKMITAKTDVFIHFNFEEGELPSKKKRKNVDCLMVRSEELDYAILKMKEPSNELTPCIFSHGISIMDPSPFQYSLLEGQRLTLIGHPHGQRKQTDLMCPVVTKPLDSLEVYGHALRRKNIEGLAEKAYVESKDQRRGTYNVSNIFEDSSGSPGIVFQNGKKQLVILHTKGYDLGDQIRTLIEQGVFLTEIYKDVQKWIGSAQQDQNALLGDIDLEDIFPSVD